MRPRPFRVQRPLAAVAACYGVGIGAGVFLPWYPALYGAALALFSFAPPDLPIFRP